MNLKKQCAAVLSGILLMTCTASVLPQYFAAPELALTVSAAEADYDWSALLKNDASWFGGSEAIKIADECIQYQVSGEGGWQKGMTTAHTGDWAHSTIDNDATTSQIRFLMRTYAQTKQQKYLDCAMKGVDCLFKMQYSNGGFMQCLNTPGTYHAHITLNDGAYLHVLSLMQEMSTRSGDFSAVSEDYAKKAASSLQKGIQCLLDMQIKVNGTLTAWCQQHNENDLSPAGARAYELPSICTSESAGVITFLYNYAKANPDRQDIVRSVNAAIKWFQKTALYDIKFDWNSDKTDKVVTQSSGAGPIWARFYTLDTEKPMFSDRDGGTYYDVSQISQERRTGYSWYGSWGKKIITLALLEEGGEPVQTTEPVPVQKPEYTGKLIAKLVVNDIDNGADWSIQQNLNVGSKIYGDRDFTVVTLPDALVGAEYVQAACDSKSVVSELATLTAATDCTLYVIVDMRLIEAQGLMPPWLAGFSQRSDVLNSSNTVTYEIFERELTVGEQVTLGSNMTGNSVVNYFAAVQLKAPETTETTTTTAPETTTTAAPETTAATEPETTATEPAPAETTTMTTTVAETTPAPMNGLRGDADCSNEVDISDAVLVARYSVEDAGANITDQGLSNADVNSDGHVTGDDAAMIVKYVAQIIDWSAH